MATVTHRPTSKKYRILRFFFILFEAHGVAIRDSDIHSQCRYYLFISQCSRKSQWIVRSLDAAPKHFFFFFFYLVFQTRSVRGLYIYLCEFALLTVLYRKERKKEKKQKFYFLFAGFKFGSRMKQQQHRKLSPMKMKVRN